MPILFLYKNEYKFSTDYYKIANKINFENSQNISWSKLQKDKQFAFLEILKSISRDFLSPGNTT